MSTKHVKVEKNLFSFSGTTDNTVAPISPKPKKKEKKISFYIKALDKISSNLNIKTTEAPTVADVEYPTTVGNICESTSKKTESKSLTKETIYEDLKLPEDTQAVQPEQPLEGSYESIWKKPRIRPNVNFEEEINFDEEITFDDEELECIMEAETPSSVYATYKKYTQSVSEDPQEVPLETKLKVPVVQEELVEKKSVNKKIYSLEPDSEYVEFNDELCDTMRKGSLFENIELQDISLSLKEATITHKDPHSSEEKMTDKPINEV